MSPGLHPGGWAAAAAIARHLLTVRASLMAGWDESDGGTGLGAVERVRGLVAAWLRRAFRRPRVR